MVVIAVVGPTAIGKSDLALSLAQRFDGEIVNADAMQFYRGLDIVTAKPTAAERRRVPHHLLDTHEVHEPASVAEYQLRARAAFEEIRSRGRTPILVGGSWLYVRGALDDLRFPGTDPNLRAALEARAAAEGADVLHAELAVRDPAAAAAIQPSNTRRVVRALEILQLGHDLTPTLGDVPEAVPSLRVGLTAPRDVLDTRIAERVRRMWEAGVVEEVRGLAGLRDSPTAVKALGVQQVLRLLDGQSDEQSAQADTIAATRAFARRQERYLRRDRRVRWFEFDAAGVVDEVADYVSAGTAT